MPFYEAPPLDARPVFFGRSARGDRCGVQTALTDLQHAHSVERIRDNLYGLGIIQREQTQKGSGVHTDLLIRVGNIDGLIRLSGQPLLLRKLGHGIDLQCKDHNSYLLYDRVRV